MRVLGWLNRLVTIALALISVLTITLLVAIVQGRHAGKEAVVMQTGSMRPLINPGDLVVIRPVPVEAIHPGDLITFREPTGSQVVVTHRVVRIENTDEGIAFVTRGDANLTDDPWTLRYLEPTGWRVAHIVPYVGQLQVVAAQPLGRAVLGGIIFSLALVILWPVFVPVRHEASTPTAQGAG